MLIFLMLIFLMQDKIPPAAPKNLKVFANEFKLLTPATLSWQSFFIMGDSLKNYFFYFGRDSLDYDSLDIGTDTKIDLAIITRDTIFFYVGGIYYNSGLRTKTKWIKYF